jgi:predicted NBD/HSP70 family sugar kinase
MSDMTPASHDGRVAARPQLIRSMNEQLLLEQIRHAAPLSRPELARLSGLSKPTVALALASLEEAGLVQVAGQRTGVRGPAALLYELRPDAGYVLALDVGREFIRGALADLAGTVRAKISRRVPAPSARTRIGEVAALADELRAAGGIRRRGAVVQTVVGSPGVFDPARGALRMAAGNLPGWEQPHVLTDLRARLGEPTEIENDVDMGAVAERDHGHGREAGTFAFVSVGTGIGMGVVIDGKLHRGAHGGAGEIAFLPLGPDVEAREARHRGHLEAAASSAAVVRAARTAGIDGHLTARRVFAAAAAGDARARAVVAREAELVAKALAAVIAVVDPELIVLGGGIGGAAGFASSVVRDLERLAPFVPEIRVSALAEDAVVLGCLATGLELAWQRVLRSRAPGIS